MRDKRFVAEHRGGPLKKAQHDQLMEWACACAEHVLPLFGVKPDARLIFALHAARAWKQGMASAGDARKASMGAIAVAKELLASNAAAAGNSHSNQAAIAVARSVGHAVATAHMADHSLGAAWYALKAVKSTGISMESEREWQNERLPDEIRSLVLSARELRKMQGV